MRFLLPAALLAAAATTCDTTQPVKDQPATFCCQETRRLRSKPYWSEERTICYEQDPEPNKRTPVGCKPRSSLVPSDVFWDD